jgi:hypothetical protein
LRGIHSIQNSAGHGAKLRHIFADFYVFRESRWFKVSFSASHQKYEMKKSRPRDLDSPEYLDVRDEIFHIIGMSLKVGAV